MHEDRDLRLVHRIESFSDMVMGFSLALLGLTLVIPQHTATLFAHLWWLVGYFWTFFYIAGVWYQHQRLFEKYFVPTRAAIFVNFVLLSMLVLVVYFVQVFGRMQEDLDKALAFLAYFAAFGASLIAIGTLYALGTQKRWNELSLEDRRIGLRRSIRPIAIGVSLTGAVIYGAWVNPSFTMESMARIGYVVIPTVLLVRIVLRFIEPRVLAAPVAAKSTT